MDKENGDGGGGGGNSKHKSSSNSNNNNGSQPNIDVNDPNSLLNAASLFGEFYSKLEIIIESIFFPVNCVFVLCDHKFCFLFLFFSFNYLLSQLIGVVIQRQQQQIHYSVHRLVLQLVLVCCPEVEAMLMNVTHWIINRNNSNIKIQWLWLLHKRPVQPAFIQQVSDLNVFVLTRRKKISIIYNKIK